MEKRRINRFCEAAALAAFVLLTAALALCALTMTAENKADDNIMLQTVTLVREPLLRSLLLSLAALAALLGVHGLLERLGGVRLGVRVDEVRAVEGEEVRRLVHQAVVAEQVLGGAATRTLGRVEPGS